MDCGPAALKSLLEGHGIAASYGRLREACQTDVDGTSIDSLETAAVALGLEASQILLPIDFFFEPEAKALPSLVVVRQAGGMTHFVVFWRRVGSFLQVMDPATGRRWVRMESMRRQLYLHTQAVPAADWLEWASGEAFARPLARRLSFLGGGADWIGQCKTAGELARLDASARMVAALVSAGAIGRGASTRALTEKLWRSEEEIPREYWSAAPDPGDPDMIRMRGAVLIQVTGRGAAAPSLPPELSAALTEKPARPGLAILRELFADGWAAPSIIALAMAASAVGVVVDAVLWRGFLNLARELVTAGQRTAALVQMAAFAVGLLILDFGLTTSLLRFGRRLELRLRLRFLEKIPRLGDKYFSSRPVSDMAQRVHNVQMLRTLPLLAGQFWRALLQCAIILAAIAWLYPEALALASLVAVAAMGIPLLVQPVLTEHDLKVRTHAGALTRYYLDALLGLTALRAHGAAGALRHEQGELLGQWTHAALRHHRLVVRVETLQFLIALSGAAWLLLSRLADSNDTGTLLLLVYWVLSLPMLGREAAAIAWHYPLLRNAALRLAEPLGAPEEATAPGGREPFDSPVAVHFDRVSVQAAGHTILEEVDLTIPAGAHVGIVGPSGAGKSSFAGLLLGWHRAASGSIAVNGRPLDAGTLDQLRRVTAWVDPQVQIWNRTLLDNLRYGADDASAMDELLEAASLRGTVERLPDGLQTSLGEGGGLVSGGEGQRVRFGRALARGGIQLAILDEPARGLDRAARRSLVERARERWRGATLLCITHDVGDVQSFERVLVFDGGRLVEDGPPQQLAADPGSRYRQLLDAEDSVRRSLWNSASWRRLRLLEGSLFEEGSAVRARAD